MKKYLLSFLILLPVISYSQVKIGLKVSPALNFNRIETNSDHIEVDSDGTRSGGLFGIFTDIPFSENYYFNTGVYFVPKGIGVKITDTSNNTDLVGRYNIQYLQIPLDLKLFTDEISIDKRLYFQIGLAADIKIKDKPVDEYDPVITEFKAYDLNLLVGGGIEIKLGENTSILGGVSYYHGFLNNVKSAPEELTIRTSMLALDVGVKF